MTVPRIGVFGGTFDPIHIGHLAAVEDAAALLSLDQVLFVPNRIPPHKMNRRVSSADDRAAMVELSIADNPRFVLSAIELNREGPSYTLDTLRSIKQELEEVDLVFLAGCDALGALHTWHQPEARLEEFQVVIMDRPTGSPLDWPAVERHFPQIRDMIRVLPVPLLEISGEDIRRRVGEGRPIRYYVVRDVERYIHVHRLYQHEQ
jgi:nicotinate-nucleotide adenylyltransferase